MASAKKLGFHYAWVVLFAACVLNIVSRADAGSFGVFVESLVKLFVYLLRWECTPLRGLAVGNGNGYLNCIRF